MLSTAGCAMLAPMNAPTPSAVAATIMKPNARRTLICNLNGIDAGVRGGLASPPITNQRVIDRKVPPLLARLADRSALGCIGKKRNSKDGQAIGTTGGRSK